MEVRDGLLSTICGPTPRNKAEKAVLGPVADEFLIEGGALAGMSLYRNLKSSLLEKRPDLLWKQNATFEKQRLGPWERFAWAVEPHCEIFWRGFSKS